MKKTSYHSKLDTFGIVVATAMTMFTVVITLMPLV